MADEIEIPQYFICPISLQIMKDPVTAVTGITYDRESIEQWLSSGKNTTCPVTKQPLPLDSSLTPNHTLRRLIQAWCTTKGVDRIPTPKSPLNKTHILKLVQDLWVPRLQLKTLKKLESLASEKESHRTQMVEAGVGKAMVSLIVRGFREVRGDSLEVYSAMNLLHCLRISNEEAKLLLIEYYDFMDSIMWVLEQEMENHVTLKTNVVLVLKSFIQAASKSQLERLRPDFFQGLIRVLKDRISHQATKATLHILLETCPWGRNRIKIIEAGAVTELIELELTMPEKKTTEMILGVLDYLCTCADGRAQLLGHAAGIAVVSKRILRVSPAANESAVHILASISKFSATNEVLKEMLRVGAVSKLCMALQAECGGNVKEKARWVLRLHSNAWSTSPCIQVYLLTRDPR
ncbi:E3 ubiquitin-protein ligase PUB24-like [Macadamia integrifolia]|uniref:E3 ubiquitin-protein ligase PUB24-like n=1 Tax=Macadamia integrifolia TaxID=60698 RepID=UPI001C4F7D94|nr:E3 ubiquitin-protein ligase PUB24-like [Macadamia integrifolia]